MEIPVSSEYFQPHAVNDGVNVEKGFQVDCGLRIQGGASRNPGSAIKHSMSLRFRKEYGEGKLDYPLFEGTAVEEFNSVQLRAMYNNSWIHSFPDQRTRATLIRDQWVRDSFIAMGRDDGGHGKYVHLYLNGLYWGVYNLHQRTDEAHFVAYAGGDEEGVEAYNPGSTASASFSAMRNVVANGTWDQVRQVLDVENYCDFYTIQHFARNDDLQGNGNWRAAGGGTSGAKWRFYPWDSERVLEDVSATGPLARTEDGVGLINDLVDFEEFRVLLADRLQKHLFNGGALDTNRNRARFQKWVDVLDKAIIAESARWGDDRKEPPYNRDDDWAPAVNNIITGFFQSSVPNRTSFVADKFLAESWPSGDKKLLNVLAPVFQVNASPMHGGAIDFTDSVGFSNTGGTVYYTTNGSDPRIPASGETPTVLLDAGAACAAHIPANGNLGLGWVSRTFDDSGASWMRGSTGVGYDRAGGSYTDLISLNVGAMKDNNSSCYIRIPFTVPDARTLALIDSLTLNMKFEDGFIAWINGVRVADFGRAGQPAVRFEFRAGRTDS